jgi:cytochrome P450/NADPH-cytochrome P450 reductase
MLPLMTPRYYSISSSPLIAADRCSITAGIVSDKAWSGNGMYEGVASTYLRRHPAGNDVDAFVKDSKSGFRLPDDPATPIVMIGPGTGVAPFRGFLQERHVLRERGTALGPARLYFGCRRPDEDFLYREELEGYAAEGIVELHVAFSRVGAVKRYVQHRIAEHGDELWPLLEAGAIVYVCGDGSRMEPDVREAFRALHQRKTGSTPEAAGAWLDTLTATGRYVLDVWAST